MAHGKFVAYYRAGPANPGRSGPELEAQRTAVADHLNGGEWQLLDEFTEVGSGTNTDLEALAKALALCNATKATLIVAKLDRLSREVEFIDRLMHSGVDFIMLDLPDVDRFTIHILATVAEHERKLFSKSGMAALAASTRPLAGYRSSVRDWTAISNSAVEKRRMAAAEHADVALPEIQAATAAGASSLRAIADYLNQRGITSPRGRQWYASQVKRLLDRYVSEPSP
jgi:DNA invertase Pin-like site-specific DNA recombinase